jgi:hypothetical protein
MLAACAKIAGQAERNEQSRKHKCHFCHPAVPFPAILRSFDQWSGYQ